MRIGLIDRDFLENPYIFAPNLQIMKLAGYYKMKNYNVSLLKNINEAQYFSKIFYCQNEDYIFPEELLYHNNITIRGYYFYPQYVPLDQEIENTIPDITIYNKLWKSYEHTFEQQQEYEYLTTCNHLQLSNGEEGINILKYYPPFTPCKTHRIYIHDRDIELIAPVINKELYKFAKQIDREPNQFKIKFKYPIQIYNYKSLFEILKLNYYVDTIINFYGNINASLLEKIYQNYSFSKVNHIIFHLEESSHTNEGQLKDLIKILEKVWVAKSYKRAFNFKYNYEILDDDLEYFLRYIKFYSSSVTKPRHYYGEFCDSIEDSYKSNARYIFYERNRKFYENIIKKYPEAKKILQKIYLNINWGEFNR